MTNFKSIQLLAILIIAILIQSCGVNSNLMLRTSKDYNFENIDIDSANQTKNEYIIGLDDMIQFRFYTNKGVMVLDISSGTGNVSNSAALNINRANDISYVIGVDSLVKLPYLDKINLVGKTIRQAERYLEDLYSDYYVDPFVQISVVNKRVLVFPGNGAEASVVYLKNNNTTLMEAIALAGGISDRGRASKIKLYRESEQGRQVYLIDLSTIQGLAYTDLVVQNGDYIHVEPVRQFGQEILREIAPIVSIITSAVLVVTSINKLNQ